MKKKLRLIHERLIQRKSTLAVAESCTGGQLSALLTSLPGSSEYFLLGAVTYQNRTKEMFLDIPRTILTKFGAVSSPVAILMASNIRKKTRADFSLGITGIAGPKGGSLPKPVGTVYICLSKKGKNTCRRFNFHGSRMNIRKKSVEKALDLLCASLSP